MKRKIMWGLVLVSLIIAAVGVNILPEQIPAHYNFEGQVDRMGSKYESFIYPAVVLGMTLFFEGFLLSFRKKIKNSAEEKVIADGKANMKVLMITAIAVSLMQIVLQVISIIKSYNYDGGTQPTELKIYSNIGMIIGIIFIVVGNILPKTKRNSVIGIRTQWSMANDETWLASNRLGGALFCIGGILIIVCTLLFEEKLILFIMTIIVVAIMIAVSVYSYMVYNKTVVTDEMFRKMQMEKEETVFYKRK